MEHCKILMMINCVAIEQQTVRLVLFLFFDILVRVSDQICRQNEYENEYEIEYEIDQTQI